MLVATTLIWGATFAITKALIDDGVAPMAIVAWRFTIASVVFAAIFARTLRRGMSRVTVVHGLVLGVLLYAGFGMQAIGLGVTSSSRSGFITALYVIFTPLLQILVTRRAPSRNVWIGIVLVLLGLWALTAPGGVVAGLVDPWSSGGFNVGDLLTLISAFFFAIYIVLLDRYSADGDIVTLTSIQLVTVALVSLGHLAVTGSPAASWAIPSTVGAWAGILYLALLASVLSTYMQTRYQRDTTPSRAAVIFTLESVFAALLGAVALGESLTMLSLAGGALILTGLLVAELSGGSSDG
ncbi:MAG TPA: DMT family transporter [Candidatus Kapabacteria bacterium]|jgi:drug/metabolite transporter (DMT)-like permease|nr:DMT family transporter [Candidatus Kapabacteria bacterium]